MKENSPELQDLYTDIPKIQKISGFTALSAVLITILLPFIFPVEAESIRNIIIVGGVAALFALIYYTIPKLYLNRKLILFTDIIFTIAISVVMLNLGEWGFFYIIFFILIIAIDAFTYKTKEFISALSLISLAVILVNYFQIGSHHIENYTDFYFTSAFQLYWIISIGIILRVFAKEALNLRQKKDAVEKTLQVIEKERKEMVTLFNTLSDLILAIDNKDRVTFANKEALSVLSLSEKNIGKEVEIIIQDKEKSISIKDLLNKKKIYRNSIKINNGTDFKRVNLTITPIFDKKENYEGSIIYMHTLTEQEELEKTKVEFAAIASHELRTPLAVIEGYAHLLLENKKVIKDVEIFGYLKTIQSSTQSLIDLSNNILTITKLESKRFNFTKTDCNLNEVIEGVVNSYTKKAEEKNLKILLSGEQLPIVKTDESKVKEIISNLVDNAIKFTDKGSITVEASKNSKEIVISIIDTGIGIKKDSQSKIFSKFFRVEDWQTRKTGGTGLGLFISKSLAELIKGRITLDTQENLGSKFSLHLPIK